MTVPTLVSVTTSVEASNVTSSTVAYPASGINSGDLLVCLWANDGTADLPTWPTGDWADNEIYQQNTSAHGSSISYIIADGTENGGSFEVTHPSETTASIILHIQNWHGTTPPESGTRFGAGTDDWEVVSLTPSWDSSVEDTFWVLFNTNDEVSNTTSWPPEFPDNRTDLTSGSASGPGVSFATDDTLEATSSIAEILTAFDISTNRVQGILGIRGAGESANFTENYISIPWNKQPPTGTKLDQRHPLYQYISYAKNFRSMEEPCLKTGTKPVIVDFTQQGGFMESTGTSGDYFDSGVAPLYDDLSGPTNKVSTIQVCRTTDINSTFWSQRDGGAGNNVCYLYLTNNNFTINTNGNDYTLETSPSETSDGLWHVVGASLTIGSPPIARGYVDGIAPRGDQVSPNTTGNAAAINISVGHRWQTYPGTGLEMDGDHQMFVQFVGIHLSEEWHASLGANPWQIFEPRKVPIYQAVATAKITYIPIIRTQQPPDHTLIAQPFSQGLIYGKNFLNIRSADVVSGNAPTVVDYTQGFAPSKFGSMGHLIVSGATSDRYDTNAGLTTVPTGEMSFLALFRTTDTGTVMSQRDGTVTRWWQFAISGTENAMVLRLGTSIFNMFSDTLVTDGEWHVVSCSVDEGRQRGFLDGVFQSSGTQVWVTNGSAVDITVGARWDSEPTVGDILVSDIAVCAVWSDRYLSDGEHAALGRNPWALFEPWYLPVLNPEAAAAGGPVITDVNTTESWVDGDTGLIATGTGFM